MVKIYPYNSRANLHHNHQLLGNFPLKEAQHLAHLLETGQCTPEEIRHRNLLLGRTVTQWAEHLGLSRNALYGAARRNHRSPLLEIAYRLPLNQRPEALQELESKKKFDF